MNLWLDDVRPAPAGYVACRSVNEAIGWLTKEPIQHMSLDHDLGDYADQGGDGVKLVLWMAEHEVWPVERPVVHSMNPVGRRNMESLIGRYFPASATMLGGS